ncbi:hypothetical protein JYU34_019301 [Plutella xylostella]|uniref:Uncharacterized protein n=1 Tax=Plutella xylostella TaxID=51655 RepID=A0ABQ7PWG8_PLUXY|nr:hypothetical protein JYU34_019301 [Plutella xylostella]
MPSLVITSQPVAFPMNPEMEGQSEDDERIGDTEEDTVSHTEQCCCLYADTLDKTECVCWYFLCQMLKPFGYIGVGIGRCTEVCFDGCADSLMKCCDSDK